MNNDFIQGGSTANLNGKIFEDTLIPIFINHGYEIFTNKELRNPVIRDRYNNMDKTVHLNAPYTSIYGHTGKTEFLITNNILSKKIRVECKWQQAAGSVDEKFPYMLLNSILAFEEDEIILIVDGGGYKPSSIEWLEQMIEERWLLDDQPYKEIRLMNLSEFINYFNRFLR